MVFHEIFWLNKAIDNNQSQNHFTFCPRDFRRSKKSTCGQLNYNPIIPPCHDMTFLLEAHDATQSHFKDATEHKQQRPPQLRKRHLKSEFALPQTLSRLFHLV